MDLVPEVFGYPNRIPRIDVIHQRITKLKEKGYTKLLESEKEILQGYIEARTKALYLLYLLVSSSNSQ